MKHLLWIILTGLVSMTLSAQTDFNTEEFKAIKARNIGPAGMSGRVTAIDVDLSNEDRIFIGTASGGVWLSENGGTSWKPIFDEHSTNLSIGALKINQSNPSEIWVGTGEGNPRNSQNSGAGVYRSLDGGRTWAFMGLKDTRVIHRIAIDEIADGVVYIGAQGAAWGNSKDRGVFKTTDGGKTWDKILYINEGTGVADMVMDPTNPKKLIVAMWEFGRTPWFFNSGGKGSGIHITHDGGETWSRVSSDDGLPKGDLGRMGIAISASNPDIVYALVEAKENALYKSYDGGQKWRKISTDDNMGNRPFYYSEIYVDPHNPDRLYSLWTYVSRSDDGGKTFRIIADYGNDVHPDHHAFWIHPDEPNYLIDGNDGGLNFSRDMGDNWEFVSNLPVGQFYHVNVDDEFPYNVYGGMQDNGSWVGPGFVLKRGGITNHDWQETFFGDGFDSAPKPGNPRYVYAMSQGGNIGLVDRETGVSTFIKPNNPDTVALRYNWNAPMALEPGTDCGIYYGSQYVHYSNDCGQSWKIISPDLTTNDTSKQHQDISGGLTYDATNAENNTTLLAIAPSPLQKGLIWAGSDDGRLHVTTDNGANWEDVYRKLPSAPKAGWIPQIKLSAHNAGEAFVVVNNYRQNDWNAYLYHTTDFGKSWRRIVDNNDVAGFVTSIIQDHKNPNLLFMGTDAGLYVSFDKGNKWTHWTEGLPPVQIRDITVQETFDDLVLGTFGRAFWIIDDIGAFRAMAEQDYRSDSLNIVSVSPAYLSEFRSYQGVRFAAQGEFRGENKSTMPMMSIWVQPKEKGSKDKDKIKFSVLNTAGDTIRTFSRGVSKEGGLQRISWNLRQDGVSYPSRRDRRADADTPSGTEVLPGDYKIIASYKGHEDSAMISVKMDPRVEVTASNIKEMKEAAMEMEQWIKRTTDAHNRIKKAKKSIALISKLTETIAVDSIKKEISKLNGDTKKELNMLEEMIMGKENVKGIQGNPNTVMSMLGSARGYIGSSYDGVNDNAMVAYKKAQKSVTDFEAKVKTFFDEDWAKYKERIDAVDFELFKDDE